MLILILIHYDKFLFNWFILFRLLSPFLEFFVFILDLLKLSDNLVSSVKSVTQPELAKPLKNQQNQKHEEWPVLTEKELLFQTVNKNFFLVESSPKEHKKNLFLDNGITWHQSSSVVCAHWSYNELGEVQENIWDY